VATKTLEAQPGRSETATVRFPVTATNGDTILETARRRALTRGDVNRLRSVFRKLDALARGKRGYS